MSNNLQQIKALRAKLPQISLSQAKELLNEYKDINSCIQEFHKRNINTICRLADCDEKSAELYYHAYRYDVNKTIEKLYHPIKCTELSINPKNSDFKIGFSCRAESDIIEQNNILLPTEELFIPLEDFELIKSAFDEVFPMEIYGQILTQISVCWKNIFNREQAQIILHNLAKIPSNNSNEEQFLRQLCYWLKKQLLFADRIIFNGNLQGARNCSLKYT